MAQKPPKTHKPAHNPYHTQPIEQATAGKIYLVRDKDQGDGKPTIWGKELPYADAHKLKEAVAATGKSRTVRFEEQLPNNAYAHLPVDPRSPYHKEEPEVHPDILAAQSAGRAAVSPIVKAANDRQAAKPKVAPPVVLPQPPKMPELPGLDDDDDLPAISQDELENMLASSDLPSADDVKAAGGAGTAEPVNLLELAVKTETCSVCSAQPGTACTDPSGPITHAERIQAAAAKLPPANDPLMEAGHA